jgi:DNA-binding XRE family transcriptional regulator
MLQKNLTTNLQYLMASHGIDSIDLAEALSISSESIIRIKNGTLSNPSLNTTISLSKYFSVSLEALVFNDLNQSALKEAGY